ncbi:DUF1707 and DUF4870 domain-containing protein [Allosalinactinospora lopnorensis]|uniref:DUF1707 and DUF4870 domain-containing protein n=1 Tax=Allosalinactinospora lopnorensis TaxID=1352348 RepID=UPI0009E521FD|nr:DUF1707 and DUF4870 domain-containing protein [Allosalinactinospora lopnorensis]
MAVQNPTPPPSPYGRGRPVPQRGRHNQYLRLTHADRDAVADLLKEAYAEGRLDSEEFDERLGLAMSAKVRADLEPLLSDLVPEGTQAFTPRAREPEPRPNSGERVAALAGHVSGYFLTALGPLAILLVSGKNSAFVRRHAIEALNFQLTFIVGTIVLWFLSWLVLPLIAWVFMLLGWLFLPMIAGLASLMGGNWKYPFTWRPVKDE